MTELDKYEKTKLEQSTKFRPGPYHTEIFMWNGDPWLFLHGKDEEMVCNLGPVDTDEEVASLTKLALDYLKEIGR